MSAHDEKPSENFGPMTCKNVPKRRHNGKRKIEDGTYGRTCTVWWNCFKGKQCVFCLRGTCQMHLASIGKKEGKEEERTNCKYIGWVLSCQDDCSQEVETKFIPRSPTCCNHLDSIFVINLLSSYTTSLHLTLDYCHMTPSMIRLTSCKTARSLDSATTLWHTLRYVVKIIRLCLKYGMAFTLSLSDLDCN